MIEVVNADADDMLKDVSSRLAAAISIDGFFQALGDDKRRLVATPEMVVIFLALYDTLVDDEEDVRDQGAKTTSFVLSAVNTEDVEATKSLSLSPPAAKIELMSLLASKYRNSGELWLEAVFRLVGTVSSSGLQVANQQNAVLQKLWKCHEATTGFTPVSQLYQKATVEQNSVFEEEKQNLYIDTVKEVDAWAGLIIQIDCSSWEDDVASKLFTWVTEGLEVLSEKLENFTDGPLGVVSKPEVYTMIVRVLVAAKVLIIRPGESSRKEQLTALLEKLTSIGERMALHEFIMVRVQEALQAAS